MEAIHELINKQLRSVKDPVTAQNIVDAGMVSAIVTKGKEVGFSLTVTAQHTEQQRQELQHQAKLCAEAIDAVDKATIVVTGEAPAETKQNAPSVSSSIPTPSPLLNIKHIIAVGAGKGGVGKSTVTVQLAAQCVKEGLRVGIADADIYGPSIAHMLGIKEKPEIQGNALVPIKAHGIYALSMGMLVSPDVATVWRGPMVTKALTQLLRASQWPELDVLFIDLPPGTGDVQLHIAQHYPLSGAVLVSTPQQISVLDVSKAANMFRKLDVPIVGLVNNMAYFQDPGTGEKHAVFGENTAQKWAKTQNIPILAEIPIIPGLAIASDQGVIGECDSFITNIATLLNIESACFS